MVQTSENHSHRPPSTENKRLFVAEQGETAIIQPPVGALVAEIGTHIVFDPSGLDRYDIKGFAPCHYDLLVICAAVELADRRWKRPQIWMRTLELSIPVIDLERWKRGDVQEALRATLSKLTGDRWHLHFRDAKSHASIGGRQRPLAFGEQWKFAIAYSDGLDSRAVASLCGPAEEVLCIRVAGNRQRRANGDSHFDRIPFKVRAGRGRESSFRSRGFQFAAITAIAAHLAKVERVVVPESGQGALGPAFLPPHGVYRDYRNHPVFFRLMEKFLNVLLGTCIQFEQPRLWSTKAKTLEAFLALPLRESDHLRNTHSCWQQRSIVNVGGRKQCGLCAACLLRRMSLHAAGVTERDDAYLISDLGAPSAAKALGNIASEVDREIMIEYGTAGVRHFHDLAQMAVWDDRKIRVHVSEVATALGATNDETNRNLRLLLKQHAEEWTAFVTSWGDQSFLLRWLDGSSR
ncbi:MAG: hypothetical protein EPO45_16515 [Sphingobium sp.]|nr:MAG: hypothetical protein EPO45_16515 [Sphingobium sp.]